MPHALIVSPHFPPVNAPDMQRARQCLPYFAKHGWSVEVLAVEADDVFAPRDPLLLETLPPECAVTRVPAPLSSLQRLAGARTIARRARKAFAAAGPLILQRRKFDLVFFTSTQFMIYTLGADWRRRYGVPYVVDWQDPWVTDFYRRTGAPPPPGGWRYRLAAAQARRHEPRVLREAAGLVATSERYIEDLVERYPWLAETPAAFIPFGVEPRDLDVARRVEPEFSRLPGVQHVVYVGAASTMQPSLRALFSALREVLAGDRALGSKLRLHFIGTSYAPVSQAVPTVVPLAHEFGVADLVEEKPGRIGHFAALRTMMEADALLLLGSNDAGYSPSKIATLALLGKPTLAVVPGDGQLEAMLRSLDLATVARFSPAADLPAIKQFLASPLLAKAPSGVPDTLIAAALTTRLVALFERAVKFGAGPSH